MTRWIRRFAATLLALPALAMSAYPDHVITLVVPYAPGGMGSVFGSLVTEAIAAPLGQSAVVNFKPGANGGLGAAFVAKAPADGYTLLMAVNSTMAINPNLYGNLQYDPIKDFAPIGMVWSSANVLVVDAASPVKSVAELIALAKSKPGALSYGSSGNGATPHLSGEKLKQLAKVDVAHVPYKGVGPALVDLMGGQVAFVFSDTSALPLIASGKLRALAVTSAKRLSVLPEVPTMQEAGVPGFVVNTWYSVVAPAGTPPDVVAKLNGALAQAVSTPAFRARMKEIAVEPEDPSTGYLTATIRSDLASWKRFIAETGIKVD